MLARLSISWPGGAAGLALHVGLQVKPSVLIGLAGAGKLFTEEVLTLTGQHNERPVIMPMSNPTHRMECNAKEAQAATGAPHV